MYLDILHVFYTYPKTSPRYILGYTSDTSRYMYLVRFLGVTLDTYQDTSGYVYLGLFLDSSSRYILCYVKIHRETKSRYMYLGHVMTRYVSEMQDTSGIHQRYMMRYMYLKCIQREMYLI
jgi:hypothetical protein